MIDKLESLTNLEYLSIITRISRTCRADGLNLDAIYVGRPSPLGNPFTIGKLHDATNILEAYEEWLRSTICKTESSTAVALNNILNACVKLIQDSNAGIYLECWCPYGNPCHGDVIKRVLMELLWDMVPEELA